MGKILNMTPKIVKSSLEEVDTLRTKASKPHLVFSSNKRVVYLHEIRTGKKGVSLVAQLVKNLPTMWETWVQSLVWEDPLEKEKATHSSILAWRIPWTL